MIILWTLQVGGTRKNQSKLVKELLKEFSKRGCSTEIFITEGDADLVLIVRDLTRDDVNTAIEWGEKIREIATKMGYISQRPLKCWTKTGFSIAISTSSASPAVRVDW
jgi:uncharacterized alkaline shock family protein YloU